VQQCTLRGFELQSGGLESIGQLSKLTDVSDNDIIEADEQSLLV